MRQVDVSAEEDKFQEVVTAGLTVLILGIETGLDKALQEMVKMPWATIETVCPHPDSAWLCLFIIRKCCALQMLA